LPKIAYENINADPAPARVMRARSRWSPAAVCDPDKADVDLH